MIGQSENVQYINSANLKGIVVTYRDLEKLRRINTDTSLILREAERIKFANSELKNLDHEYAIITHKKLKHLESIRTHIANVGLITGIDLGNRVFPPVVARICNSIGKHGKDLSFYVMRVYEPDLKISEEAPEERTLATAGTPEINIRAIMADMEFPEEVSKGVDKIYREGVNMSTVIALLIGVYNYRSQPVNVTVDADVSEI